MTAIQPPDPDVNVVIRRAEVGAFLQLFTLDLSAVIAGAPVLRFTDTAAPDGSMIRRDGNAYVPISIESEGYDMGGDGAIPQPLLRVSNVAPIVSPLLDQTQQLRRALVTRELVHVDWIDGGDDENPTYHMRRDLHRVEQMTSLNPDWIEFRLAAPIDVGDEQGPRRQVLRDVCTWAYRVPDGIGGFDYSNATCPYVGSSYFDVNDNPTVNPEEDQCSNRTSGCRLRFAGSAKPNSNFPGIGTGR